MTDLDVGIVFLAGGHKPDLKTLIQLRGYGPVGGPKHVYSRPLVLGRHLPEVGDYIAFQANGIKFAACVRLRIFFPEGAVVLDLTDGPLAIMPKSADALRKLGFTIEPER